MRTSFISGRGGAVRQRPQRRRVNASKKIKVKTELARVIAFFQKYNIRREDWSSCYRDIAGYMYPGWKKTHHADVVKALTDRTELWRNR